MSKPYPVSHVVNWFAGNICTRRCYEEEREARVGECYSKLRAFADSTEKAGNATITHKEFFHMVEDGAIDICKHRKEKVLSVKEYYGHPF